MQKIWMRFWMMDEVTQSGKEQIRTKDESGRIICNIFPLADGAVPTLPTSECGCFVWGGPFDVNFNVWNLHYSYDTIRTCTNSSLVQICFWYSLMKSRLTCKRFPCPFESVQNLFEVYSWNFEDFLINVATFTTTMMTTMTTSTENKLFYLYFSCSLFKSF